MTRTIRQINQQLLKQCEVLIKDACENYGPDISTLQTKDGGYCKDYYADSIASDYAAFYEAIADRIDQAQPLWFANDVEPSRYQFENGYDNDPDVESWIKDPEDRAFYIKQAKVIKAQPA